MVWSYITSYTSRSPAHLLAFGAVCIAGTWLIGSAFSKATTGGLDQKQRRIVTDEMTYDNKRVANAQQQRLSSMLKDIAEGRGDEHWKAVMRGTVLPHPLAENKTDTLDRERLARALSAAKQ